MHRLILASASPRRKDLLDRIGLSPEVIVSSATEEHEANLPPEEVASTLALRKAEDVARSVGNGLVIGADTIVVLGDRILGKPASREAAAEMLRELGGQTHIVISGVALIRVSDNKMEKRSFTEQTEVTFGTLEERDIRRYVASGLPMDKAGGYGIQDSAGSLFVEKICGAYETVVGLPLHALCREMKSFAPEYLEPITLT